MASHDDDDDAKWRNPLFPEMEHNGPKSYYSPWFPGVCGWRSGAEYSPPPADAFERDFSTAFEHPDYEDILNHGLDIAYQSLDVSQRMVELVRWDRLWEGFVMDVSVGSGLIGRLVNEHLKDGKRILYVNTDRRVANRCFKFMMDHSEEHYTPLNVLTMDLGLYADREHLFGITQNFTWNPTIAFAQGYLQQFKGRAATLALKFLLEAFPVVVFDFTSDLGKTGDPIPDAIGMRQVRRMPGGIHVKHLRLDTILRFVQYEYVKTPELWVAARAQADTFVGEAGGKIITMKSAYKFRRGVDYTNHYEVDELVEHGFEEARRGVKCSETCTAGNKLGLGGHYGVEILPFKAIVVCSRSDDKIPDYLVEGPPSRLHEIPNYVLELLKKQGKEGKKEG